MNLSDVRKWLLVLVVAVSASGLPGCGQKGPLYLPEEEEQEQEQRPAGQGSRGSAAAAVA